MKRTIPASILGLILILVAYRRGHTFVSNNDIGILFTDIFLILLPFIIFIWIFINDYRDYRKRSGSWKNFIPTIVSTCFSIVAAGIFNSNDDLAKSLSLIGGYSVSDKDRVYLGNQYVLDFKKDGSYYLMEQAGNLQKQYYGTYNFKDSTMQLDKQYNFGEFKTDKFLLRVFPRIRSYITGIDTTYFAHILLLDNDKKIIDCGFHFYADWDWKN